MNQQVKIKVSQLLVDGARHMQSGNLQQANSCYQQAFALDPDNVMALSLSSALARKAGRDDIAENMLRRAVQLDPAFREAWYNLGVLLFDSNRYDEAHDVYARALKLAPDDAGILNNLATTLYKLERNTDALPYYERAVTLKPNWPEAWQNYGNCLMAIGKIKEAEEAFEKAIAANPDFAQGYRSLSLVRKFKAEDKIIPQMEALSEKFRSNDRAACELHFALGKAYDDCKDYDTAFTHYLEANARNRKQLHYDYNDVVRGQTMIRELFPKLIAEQKIKGCDDSTPVFLVGMPRCGSTLAEQIMAAHPQVYCTGEISLLQQVIFAESKGGSVEFLATDQKRLDRIANSYLDALRKQAGKKVERITNKMLDNYKMIGAIALIFPKSTIIHCVRNPMDTCVSIFRTHFGVLHPYAYNLKELGQYYRSYQDLMAFWHQLLPGRIYDLHYEKLVADFEPQARSLIEHCGLTWDSKCVEFYKAERSVLTASSAQVRSPLYNSSIEAWRRYEKHLGPLKEALRL